MKDDECVAFLRWALPQLHMRWPGFRRVRRQVCKRIDRRRRELGLASVADYRARLQERPDEEWPVLDGLCRVTISRFFRGKEMFRTLGREVMPELARQVKKNGGRVMRCWSAGCASGEEPFTLSLIWRFAAVDAGELDMRVIGTDSDPAMLARAGRACYPPSSLQELPEAWRREAFYAGENLFCLRPEHRAMVEFRCQDIRRCQPAGPFQLILCCNLVFTYYDSALQKNVLEKLADRLDSGGALVIGAHEKLPGPLQDLVPWYPHLKIYRKQEEKE
jgi:chemotaxis protein methyltransferase CheR